jgi:hypothetical protein
VCMMMLASQPRIPPMINHNMKFMAISLSLV